MNAEWIPYRCPVCRSGILFETQGPLQQPIRRTCRTCKKLRYFSPPHEPERSSSRGHDRPLAAQGTICTEHSV